MAVSNRSSLGQAARASLRWLYFVHRWLGVGACLLFAMWFLSGLVMMYVPYPAFTQQERLVHLPAIAWSKVRIGPQAALDAAGVAAYPEELRLEMAGDTPVWRIAAGGRRQTLSAQDGRDAGDIDETQARKIAQAYAPGAHPRLIGEVRRDQWTVASGYDRARPFYLFDLRDLRGGRLYVSQRLGEVVLETSGRERFWNWIGSVPHWLYPTVLRENQPAWRQVVMWVSGVCVVSAVTGMWIGILRVRIKRRPGQHASPYRGWMKWHHWAGLIGGVFLTTWIVSGWWSVNPFRWFDTPGAPEAGLKAYSGSPGAAMPADLGALERSMAGARQVRFYWLQGRPLAAVDGAARVIDPRTGLPIKLSDEALFAAASQIVPAPVSSAIRQTGDDDYWYSHHEKRPLPVLRIAFSDVARTWVYVHPVTGDVLDVNNASSRAYRWVFAGVHQLDFRFLVRWRPAWDVTMWLLLLGGTITSISGVVIGWRRLRRRRIAPS